MLHPPPVLWQPQIGGVLGALRTHRQPQTAQRLMRALGLAGMAPGPNISRAHPQHKVYP